MARTFEKGLLNRDKLGPTRNSTDASVGRPPKIIGGEEPVDRDSDERPKRAADLDTDGDAAATSVMQLTHGESGDFLHDNRNKPPLRLARLPRVDPTWTTGGMGGTRRAAVDIFSSAGLPAPDAYREQKIGGREPRDHEHLSYLQREKVEALFRGPPYGLSRHTPRSAARLCTGEVRMRPIREGTAVAGTPDPRPDTPLLPHVAYRQFLRSQAPEPDFPERDGPAIVSNGSSGFVSGTGLTQWPATPRQGDRQSAPRQADAATSSSQRAGTCNAYQKAAAPPGRSIKHAQIGRIRMQRGVVKCSSQPFSEQENPFTLRSLLWTVRWGATR
ncbi:hypothetical protein HPB47_021336 [Ixodes persulcatus]|uniref:Uncharacterized protein n=1 Tax=Ixodes persulcatus TaxID=34615 RepID=A0AC60QGC2_IXOPE|nr:hypothetical protein HPB47_021336 [Ixodes persulcatus]